MKKSLIVIAILLSTIPALCGPLVVSSNPRYFTDGTGKAIYLTGMHTWGNLHDFGQDDPPAAFDFDAYLSFLTTKNHNFTRMWAISLPREDSGGGEVFYTTPFPWSRTGPGNATDGKLKFDLTAFNQTYFDRLRARVIAAGNAGIYVGLMLFEGWGMQWARNATDGFPLTGANNINGVDAGAGIEALTLDDAAVTAVQDAYVKKVIDTVQDLNNVLYEIANEANGTSTAWQAHMIALIKAYEISEGYTKHPVGFTFQQGSSPGTNATLFTSDADWISPGATDTDGYDYATNPRPAAGTKVILSDTDHLWGIGGDRDWVWRSFTRGLNPIYMDCYDSVQAACPSSYEDEREDVRLAMGYTRSYADRMGLLSMTPQGALASTAHCLANAGEEYLIYQPGSGAFDVYLAGVTGAFDTEWFNPATGATTPAAQTTGGATRSMTPPFSGPAVLYLVASLPAASRSALAVSVGNTAFAVAPGSQALTVHWPE